MKKHLLGLILTSLTITCFSQGRLILNNGGIVAITNSAFVVIDNPNPNAITRISTGHIISEGEFNRVKWNIGTTAGTYIVPFGTGTSTYLPVSLTTAGAAGAAGSLTFAMYPVGSWLNSSKLPTGVTNFVNNYGTDNSAFAVDRFWRIEPANYTTKPALTNLTFTYQDPEWSVANNTIIESNLIAQRYNNSTNSWDDYMPATVTNTGGNTSTVLTLPSGELYTWWTLVDNRFPLPVELVSFNAVCNGDKVTVNWQTASEKNNSYFEIERSTDAVSFTSIQKVNSKGGNSSAPQSYTTTDDQPLNGKTYYRLKQVDQNGEFTYSSVVVVNCTASVNTIPSVSIYPNPATNDLTVNIKNIKGVKSLMIYDVIGQEMMNKTILSEDENVVETLDVSRFAKATYILRIDVNKELYQIIKFVKN